MNIDPMLVYGGLAALVTAGVLGAISEARTWPRDPEIQLARQEGADARWWEIAIAAVAVGAVAMAAAIEWKLRSWGRAMNSIRRGRRMISQRKPAR